MLALVAVFSLLWCSKYDYSWIWPECATSSLSIVYLRLLASSNCLSFTSFLFVVRIFLFSSLSNSSSSLISLNSSSFHSISPRSSSMTTSRSLSSSLLRAAVLPFRLPSAFAGAAVAAPSVAAPSRVALELDVAKALDRLLSLAFSYWRLRHCNIHSLLYILAAPLAFLFSALGTSSFSGNLSSQFSVSALLLSYMAWNVLLRKSGTDSCKSALFLTSSQWCLDKAAACDPSSGMI